MFRSKSSIYALLAVLEIAKRQASGDKSGVQAGQIAQAFGLPAAYAAKVMSQLARSRILKSERGPRGGFRLLRSVDQVTLLDVIDAVNGLEDGYRDAIAGRAPKNIRRGLADVFRQAAAQTRQALGDITVGDFLRKWSGGPAR